MTDFGFTGQRLESGFRLMDYNARYYSPRLGRFVSADTVIPGAGNPLAWDRYGYTLNNPLRYSDPGGHKYCDGENTTDCSRYSNSLEHVARMYGILFSGDGWTSRNKWVSLYAAEAVGHAFANDSTAHAAFRSVYGHITLTWGTSGVRGECADITVGGCTSSAHDINFVHLSLPGGNRTAYLAFIDARNNVVHEFGHAFAKKWYYRDANGKSVYSPDGPYGTQHPIPKAYLNDKGFYPEPKYAERTWRQHPCEKDGTCSPHEVFADMFLGWVFDKWANNDVGIWRDDYMTTNMAEWVPTAIHH